MPIRGGGVHTIALGCGLNGSTQHPYKTAPLGFRSRGSYKAVQSAGAATDSVERAGARKTGWRREPLSEQAIRVVVGTRLPLLPRIGTRRSCESLAITLIQRHFRQAIVFRQSVASIGGDRRTKRTSSGWMEDTKNPAHGRVFSFSGSGGVLCHEPDVIKRVRVR